MEGIKVVFIHNDFRVYWKVRLSYLRNYLANYGISMNVIEIFGQVTAYSFDKVSHKEYWWECLFPDEKFSELDVIIVRQKNQERLNDINPSYIFYP